MKKLSILILSVLYLVWPLWQVVDYISLQPFADTADWLNWTASILAYNWLLLNLLLGLKLPVLQNLFPYDWRIRTHIVTSLGILVFVTWHAVYYGIILAKALDWVVWALIGTLALMALLAVVWIPLPGFRRFREAVVRLTRLAALADYDSQKLVHKGLTLGLALLAWLHIGNAEIMEEVSPVSAAGFQALFLVTLAAFVFTRIRNLLLPRLEVQSVSSVAGTTRLSLKAPPRFRYHPGQFAFLRFHHPELRGEEHPFSFTSAPHEDKVEFAIRSLGDHTAKVTSLKPGDKVRVNGGFGAFRPWHNEKALALVGTGIGIAPLVSILKDLSVRQPERRADCWLSVPSRSHLIDPAALEEIRSRMPNLDITILAEDEGAPRFSREMFDRIAGGAESRSWYVCASGRVRTIILDLLGQLRVPASHVHYEAFNLG